MSVPLATLPERVAALDWPAITTDLNAFGCARTGPLLSAAECAALAKRYTDETGFRSRVVMSRHGFGRGEYRYFAYPLPEPVASLRTALYPPLRAVANDWQRQFGEPEHYPECHAEYLARCHRQGQTQPTPLLLRYASGDYNCLHQDLYGDEMFPLQAAFLLSDPDADFTGGEFVMTEQRPRMQSRVEVVPLALGEAVLFAVSQRPVHGTRGVYKVRLRHGVSRLRSGHRHTLGVIFHDAGSPATSLFPVARIASEQ